MCASDFRILRTRVRCIPSPACGEDSRSSRRLALIVLVALGALAVADGAHAQFYKGKTLTMIINYPAGGPSDIEGRIVAQHLPAHIAGKPNIVIKNVGGAGGVIGTNQLADAAPDGETMGFFTLDVVAQLLGNPALRVNYADFAMLAAVEEPLVAYARKDTPPGLKVATDIMQAKEFKALSLNAQNSNTINQALSLDLLGLKYRPIPAYRGLKEVETAILQNEGQFANTSLPGWTASVEPTMGDLVLPLWQLAPRGKDGSYPRSAALPHLPTFEEFYATVKGGKQPSGFAYEVLRAGSDPLVAMFRTALMPPKAPNDLVTLMRSAFVELWKDPAFIRDYSNVVKTKPILVTGEEAQAMVAALAKVKPEIKAFLLDYSNRLVR
jgi:tripartite-type tricarboxylate transporter receptor subunit TctC